MGIVVLNGATSGATTLQPTDAVTATLTFPGNTGTVLTSANPQSGGVIQVVQATTTTQASSATTTLLATGLSASITPKFATSKILAIVSQNGCTVSTSGQASLRLLLRRSGSSIAVLATDGMYLTTATQLRALSYSECYLDSPATTSSITYDTVFANNQNSGTVYVQYATETSTLTLLEIAA